MTDGGGFDENLTAVPEFRQFFRQMGAAGLHFPAGMPIACVMLNFFCLHDCATA